MITKNFFLSVLCIIYSATLFAQDAEIRPLNVGDKIPNLKFEKILNYPVQSVAIDDFKGKLLILDFWATTCAICIKQFPRLDSIQKKFGDKIMILPVGFDGTMKGSIEKLVTKWKGTKREMSLPTTVQAQEDSMLMKLFPFSSVPLEIWINEDGVVIGITNHQAVTESNIEDILNKKMTSFPQRVLSFPINVNVPFLLKRQANQLLYGSAFSGYIDSLYSDMTFGYQLDSSYYRFFDVNRTFFDYYLKIYGRQLPELYSQGNKRIIIESQAEFLYKDWADYQDADNWGMEEFVNRHQFCYEAIFPKSFSLDRIYKYMAVDMDRFFSVTSSIEKRKIKCLYLKKIPGKHSKNTGTPLPGTTVISSSLLTEAMNDYPRAPVILDNTSGKEAITISLPPKWDYKTLKKMLNQVGFDLVDGDQLLSVLVIKMK